MLHKMRSEPNRIVVHYKDGKLLKGYTLDFSPIKEIFHLTSAQERDEEQVYEISIDALKAIFFVKTLEGNKDYIEKKRFDDIGSISRGLKIEVRFRDGEVIRGTSLVYSKERTGFFMIPVDPESNNERIFVLANALRDVKTGGAAVGEGR